MTDHITIPRALLERCYTKWMEDADPDECGDLVDAIRAELAKPVRQVEPVAWMDDFGNVFPIGANKGAGSWMDAHKRSWKPLYLRPPIPVQHDAPDAEVLKAERDGLLAALKELLSELEYGHACPLTKEKSRAAIARAEGRTE